MNVVARLRGDPGKAGERRDGIIDHGSWMEGREGEHTPCLG